MARNDDKLLSAGWRVMAAVLGTVAIAVAGLRFYYAATVGFPEGEGRLFLLRVVFPLLLGLFFVYVAATGKVPGLSKER